MKLLKSCRSRAGFTLLETMISVSMMGVVGYGVSVAVESGTRAHATVEQIAEETRSLRKAVAALTEDLRATRESTLTITELVDGNCALTLQQPIEVDGGFEWGVQDRHLGTSAAAQIQAGWFVRYTVRTVTSGGNQNRQLVRQLLDESSEWQREDVLAEGLRSGTGALPGFAVVKTGAMYVVTISTMGEVSSTSGSRAVFHAQLRNE